MNLDFSLKRSQCTPGQWGFLHARDKMVLLSGGFGAGKTLALGLKLLQLKAANPNTPGLLLAQSWRALWSITLRRMMGFLRRAMPRQFLPRVVDKSGECFLDFGDGVPIFLRSAKDESTFDGLDVGFALGDEIRHWPKRSHEVLMGRVRVKCALPQIAYASTPAMNWMADEFNKNKPNRKLITSPTSENAKNLAPGFIEDLKLSYSKRLWRAVVEGLFTILEGAVYEEFDPSPDSPWVVDYEYNEHRQTFLTLDPGFRRSAWVFIQEVAPAEWIVFDELMPDNTSDDSCVQMVNDRNYGIDEIWCDPAAEQQQSAFDIDVLDMLEMVKTRGPQAIRHVVPPFTRIPYGVDKTRTLLGDPDSGQPIRIKFAKSLLAREEKMDRGVVQSMASYQYPEVKDGRPVTDIPLKDGKFDHACDAVRQFTVGRWLSDNRLRSVDRKLKEISKAGFKVVDRAA